MNFHGFINFSLSDGQRDLQRELSMTIAKVEDGLAKMFMGREQAKLEQEDEESSPKAANNSLKKSDIQTDLKLIGDNEDDSMSLEGLANFNWDDVPVDLVTESDEIIGSDSTDDNQISETVAATDGTPATDS